MWKQRSGACWDDAPFGQRRCLLAPAIHDELGRLRENPAEDAAHTDHETSDLLWRINAIVERVRDEGRIRPSFDHWRVTLACGVVCVHFSRSWLKAGWQ